MLLSSNQTSLHLHSNSGYVGLGGSVMLLLLLFQDLFFYPTSPTRNTDKLVSIHTSSYTHTHTHFFREHLTQPTQQLKAAISHFQ